MSFFWPLPAGAAIAASLLLAVAGYEAVQVAGLTRDLTAEQRLQSVPSYFLAASRSAGQVITTTPGQRKIALAFSQSPDRAFPFYRCEIRDAAGRVVASDVLEAPTSGDELQGFGASPARVDAGRLYGGYLRSRFGGGGGLTPGTSPLSIHLAPRALTRRTGARER